MCVELNPQAVAVACDPLRILVADDEASIRNVLTRIIHMHFSRYHLDVVCNGAEAYECFVKWHHGIVITDLMMPKRTGDQAFQDISEFCHKNNWAMPAVIFMSGFPASKIVSKAISGKTQHCLLSKPVHQTDLLAKIRERMMSLVE